jgi:cell wall-associated NlpC family hydrolase
MTILIPAPPMSARDKFLLVVEALVDQVVVMGALDCSETVAVGVRAASGGKLKQSDTHRAQDYFNETRALTADEKPIAGDLGFYGHDGKSVSHVVIFLGPGRILSADGATFGIRNVDAAKEARARVRIHPSENYRHDVPFLGWHRNTILDSIDFVTH